MKISEIGKISISIVAEILVRRIEWIKENEPHAIREIEDNEMALSVILNLADLDVSI